MVGSRNSTPGCHARRKAARCTKSPTRVDEDEVDAEEVDDGPSCCCWVSGDPTAGSLDCAARSSEVMALEGGLG